MATDPKTFAERFAATSGTFADRYMEAREAELAEWFLARAREEPPKDTRTPLERARDIMSSITRA